MKEYVDFVLKKEKKPVDIEKIYEKVESLKKIIDSNYVMTTEDMEEVDKVLATGLAKYDYYMTPTGRYTFLFKTSFRKGRFHGNRAGEGFVVSNVTYVSKDGKRIVKDEKFNISKSDCNHAVDGDFVLIDIGGNGKKPQVVKIIDRNIGNVIGTVTRVGNGYFVKPIDKKKQLLSIMLKEDVKEGDIVSVSLEEEKDENFYIGKVIRTFEHKDDPHSDALLEAFKSGMPEGFSEESIEQARNIPSEVLEKDKSGRYDFTDWEVFSIDGADTKDKDDCVSLKVLENGDYLLGVHIADVSYYVPEGSPIDKDAFRKGTSYYFGGCVEPQLPVELSNGICSLNEGVERLTKSILIRYDKDGNVVSRSLVQGVIKSCASLTYDEVNDIYKHSKISDEHSYLKDTLGNMFELTYILRKNRLLGGAIIFNRPEVRFKHDSNGNATEVNLRYEEMAETMIEEFMLAANSNVAEILTEAKIPCIYRIHDVPNAERISDFLRLLNAINMEFPYDVDEILKDKKVLQTLAVHIGKDNGFSAMLNTNLVKCMSHALYSSTNIGHYGTGFGTYAHFTSPIRRLADLGISRILDQCYFEENSIMKDKNIKKWVDLAPDYANQASKMEKVEEEVEKNVLYMDTANYLSQFVGQEFEGTIITVSNSGICIQLDNLLEGKVRNRNLVGEYVLNPQTYTLLSLNNSSNYYVGDRLRLELIGTDKDTKAVDFIVKEKIKENVIKDYKHTNQYVKIKAKDDKIKKAYI